MPSAYIEDNNLLYLSVGITDSVLPEMVVFTETPQKKLPALAGVLWPEFYKGPDLPFAVLEVSR